MPISTVFSGRDDDSGQGGGDGHLRAELLPQSRHRRQPSLMLRKMTNPAVNCGWNGWNDFISVDDDADTAESCMNKGIVSELRDESDAEESDEDETTEPAPISAPVAMGYIESLRQLTNAKGLGEVHASALNKQETSLI
ncbi:hypothetical protein V5799_005870 [Amblyomma americanum]|uniref:Uncharacterized protein n=1 Tax=Amblyomma americanum TaxID=6943 RepID=A0AAQ4DY09_AMBAM